VAFLRVLSTAEMHEKTSLILVSFNNPVHRNEERAMVKYCPHCGKALTDDITTVCSHCGNDINKISPPATVQKNTTMDRQELFARAIPFFTTRNYAVLTQTDYVVAFESKNRDVNWLIFLFLCCFGIIPAAVYYYWFTHRHQVTLSLSGATEVTFSAIGNTDQARKDAGEFMQSIL
jgi:hypothetical protein